MSHNKITVGGQSPNDNSEISPELNNLSDVSVSSPSENQLLKYSSGSWTAQTQGAGASKELVYSFATYITTTYSGGTGNYTSSSRFMWRAAGGAVVENGVTDVSQGSNWRKGLIFASVGTYIIYMNLQHYGTGNAVWRFYDETNTTFFGPKFRMSNTGDKMPVIVQNVTTTSVNQHISLAIDSISTPSAVGTAAELRAVSINVYKI